VQGGGSEKVLLKRVHYRFGDGKVLDPLRTPLRLDFFAGNTPDFLSVTFEKSIVEFFSKPVDEKIFQGFDGILFCQTDFKIAGADLECPVKTEIFKGLKVQFDGIAEQPV